MARGTAIAVVCALALSACSVHRVEDVSAGGGGGGGRTTGTTVAPAPAGSNRQPGAKPGKSGLPTPSAAVDAKAATDRGITADDITIGLVAFKADTFASLGVNLSGKPIEEIARPFRDEINEHGGINGRRVVLAVTRYSPLIPADVQAACVEQSEDDKVFLTLASPGFGSPGEICMAAKQTPVITTNNSSADTLYRRTAGWVRSTAMSKDRMARNWVDWLVSSRTATPATRIGLIYADSPEDSALVNDVLVPYLRQKGLNVAVKAGFSGTTVDTVTAEAQTTVLKMKMAGVDLVLPDLDFLRTAAFVMQAQSAQYKPRYSVSDLGQLATDLTTFFYPASQFGGTTGITATITGARGAGAMPTGPSIDDCLAVYRAHGQELSDDITKRPFELVQLLYVCEHLHLVAEVAKRAGPVLNRNTFLAAFDGLGSWSERVTLTNPLSFGPQKYDGPDDYAVVRWDSPCGAAAQIGCFHQVQPFRRGAW